MAYAAGMSWLSALHSSPPLLLFTRQTHSAAVNWFRVHFWSALCNISTMKSVTVSGMTQALNDEDLSPSQHMIILIAVRLGNHEQEIRHISDQAAGQKSQSTCIMRAFQLKPTFLVLFLSSACSPHEPLLLVTADGRPHIFSRCNASFVRRWWWCAPRDWPRFLRLFPSHDDDGASAAARSVGPCNDRA